MENQNLRKPAPDATTRDDACCRQVLSSHELYPERVMGLHLNHSGLSLKSLDGFRGVLARAGENSSASTITYVDPFAKASSVVQLEPRLPLAPASWL